MAADRMIGQAFIESELEIEKILRLHTHWWLMFSGTVPNVFDIYDEARRQLDEEKDYDIAAVTTLLEGCYRRKRLALAEAAYLVPRGWTLDQLQAEGLEKLGDFQFRTLSTAIADYRLDLDLVVAGFDGEGTGHIFTVANPGTSSRQDIPGCCAIGNGWFGALYFMYFREMSPRMTAAEALYHVFEAKVIGYQAGGIGDETDLVVARFKEEPIRLQGTKIPRLCKLWDKFGPQPTRGLERALGRYVKHQVEHTRGAEEP